MFKVHIQRARLFVPLIFFLATLPARPQNPQSAPNFHRLEMYAAFSYAHIRLDTETAVFEPTSRNFYGFQTGIKLNLNKAIGIWVLDGGVQWGGTKVPNPLGTQFKTSTRLEALQALFGPEFTLRNPRLDLFAHTLVGLNRTALIMQFSNNSAELDSRTHFAFGTGGGVDFPLREDVALRVGTDYIPTRVSGGWENDFRSYVGAILRF